MVPPNVMQELEAYLKDRVPPCNFVRAVLENDLFQAVRGADDVNMTHLTSIVAFVYWQMPMNCRGTPGIVERWLRREEAPFVDGTKPVHQVVVTYTTADDGVHLHCNDCGWDKCLGYDPTPLICLTEGKKHQEAPDAAQTPQGH